MATYVDNSNNPRGRHRVCHLFADTTEELIQIGKKLGLNERWVSMRGTHLECFDLWRSKRTKAIKHGAISITRERVAEIIEEKKIRFSASWKHDFPDGKGLASGERGD